MEIKLKIIDELGLHARPASQIASTASKFDSEITVESNGKSGNLKSVMSIMAMAVKKDDEIIIKISGSDESNAKTAIEQAFKDNKLA